MVKNLCYLEYIIPEFLALVILRMHLNRPSTEIASSVIKLTPTKHYKYDFSCIIWSEKHFLVITVWLVPPQVYLSIQYSAFMLYITCQNHMNTEVSPPMRTDDVICQICVKLYVQLDMCMLMSKIIIIK